jgi:hypothetical protein
MPVYRERLGVPARWWLAGLLTVGLAGSLLWAGLSAAITLSAYVLALLVTTVVLLAWGAAVIEVTATELRAGRARLPVGQVGRVLALDRVQTRALRGQQADPAAFLLIRPYLPEAVYVEVSGRPAGWPYLLLATKRPAALAAAIERAHAALAAGGACDDSGGGDSPAAPAAAPPGGEDADVSEAP